MNASSTPAELVSRLVDKRFGFGRWRLHFRLCPGRYLAQPTDADELAPGFTAATLARSGSAAPARPLVVELVATALARFHAHLLVIP
jgi:hypothetical protein